MRRRWDREGEGVGKFMPFIVGPRNCIGFVRLLRSALSPSH
jgi:hypothetical protein